MKTIGNIITILAAFAFTVSMCMLDAEPILGITILYVSGIVLAARCYQYEQKRIREGKR